MIQDLWVEKHRTTINMNKYFVEVTKGTSRARQKTSHLNRFQIQKMDENHLYINYFGKQKRLEPQKDMLYTNSNGSPVDFGDVKKELVTESVTEAMGPRYSPHKETGFIIYIDGKKIDEEIWSGHIKRPARLIQARLEREEYPEGQITVVKQWYTDGKPVETPFEFGPPEYKHHGPMHGTSPAFQDV